MLQIIKKWASEAGLLAREITDPQADFHFAINEPNLPYIDLVHQKVDDAYVILASNVAVSQEDREKLTELDEGKRAVLLTLIKQRLLQMGVEFRIEGEEIPSIYRIFARAYFEQATTQDFWEIYLRLKNALFLVIWSIHEAQI
jgi:hypothetical protein